ncbi:hypothetical protein ACTFIR_002289 [Dictyostelium discoideum]
MKYNRCPCTLEIYGCNENCKCLCKANSINGQSPKAQKSKVVQFKKNKNNPNTFVSSKHGITNNNINPYHIYYDHTPSVNTISPVKYFHVMELINVNLNAPRQSIKSFKR